MKLLSNLGSPIPSLAFRELSAAAREKLDEELLTAPSSFVPGCFHDITHQLRNILEKLPFAVLGEHNDEDTKKRVLDATELLMLKLSVSHESLSRTVSVLSTNASTRSLRLLKQQLSNVIDNQFKIPINLVKHDGFTLRWLDARTDSEQTSGFVVSGLIEKGVVGPANQGLKPRAVSEGYSFAKTLRDAFSSFYAMCSITEDALSKSGALEKLGDIETTTNHAFTVKNESLIAALNNLSTRCFPNEHGAMVSEFLLQDGSIFETKKKRLLFFQQGCQFKYTFMAEKGVGFKMPYWIPQDP